MAARADSEDIYKVKHLSDTFPSVPYFPTFLIPFSFYHCYGILVFLIKDHGNQWIQVILFSLFIKCACNLNMSCMVNWQSVIFPPHIKDHTFGHQNHTLKIAILIKQT